VAGTGVTPAGFRTSGVEVGRAVRGGKALNGAIRDAVHAPIPSVPAIPLPRFNWLRRPTAGWRAGLQGLDSRAFEALQCPLRGCPAPPFGEGPCRAKLPHAGADCGGLQQHGPAPGAPRGQAARCVEDPPLMELGRRDFRRGLQAHRDLPSGNFRNALSGDASASSAGRPSALRTGIGRGFARGGFRWLAFEQYGFNSKRRTGRQPPKLVWRAQR